jgi:hypothetical protein
VNKTTVYLIADIRGKIVVVEEEQVAIGAT